MNYFGTDGIRGDYPTVVSPKLAYKLGMSLALMSNGCNVLIARDSRLSGEELFNNVAQGVNHGGGTAINLGILPTNAVAHFLRKLGADYGVMISASHNKPTDNGLKVFDSNGYKIDLSMQQHISRIMDLLNCNYIPCQVHEPVFYNIANMYCHDLLAMLPTQAYGMRVAVDCGEGSTSKLAKKLLKRCGCIVDSYFDRGDGSKINVNCGATNGEVIASLMDNCHLAFSYDGDGDRIVVAENNKLIDNNAILLCLARYLKEHNALAGNTVVGTVLTNGALPLALKNYGINFVATAVGDSNISAVMQKNGYSLGGENSGHYILSHYATTSDSLLTTLMLINIYQAKGSLIEYSKMYQPLASSSVNIDIDGAEFSEKQLADLSQRLNKKYQNNRVVLRKSGTENKLRCYAEGQNHGEIADEVVATLAKN